MNTAEDTYVYDDVTYVYDDVTYVSFAHVWAPSGFPSMNTANETSD